MTTDQANQNAADRKVEERAEESRQRREASATDQGAERPNDPPGPSTADLARAGSAPEDEGRSAQSASDDESDDNEQPAALFADQDASEYRSRWQDVQVEFVDDPRQAVQRADALVAQLMQELAETFASERSTLEQQWDRGGEVSTEDLRISLRRYRSFFDRLLSL